jgi:hypothetical protein
VARPEHAREPQRVLRALRHAQRHRVEVLVHQDQRPRPVAQGQGLGGVRTSTANLAAARTVGQVLRTSEQGRARAPDRDACAQTSLPARLARCPRAARLPNYFSRHN